MLLLLLLVNLAGPWVSAILAAPNRPPFRLASQMTPERWQQVKKIFDLALQCEPQQRAAYLAEACAGDAALCSEVESLLSAHSDAGGFIEEPIVNSSAVSVSELSVPQSTAEADRMLGRHLGSYRLVKQIGHGGMGTVYLAVRDDDQFTRRAAIKLVSRGMDTDFILRRFRNERQILADLDHPNIARLYDGGTTEDGLPYFIMEYIEGQPLLEYCEQRKLGIEQRLKLFREVCVAVHYAHQKQVVHRDLKPGNILVTTEGFPKLLDFGIAKILKSDTSGQTLDATLTMMRMMTPHFASPEQVRGEPVGPASDVYSLGVVLFELLTGHRPYRLKNLLPHEIAQAICETDPEKPSTAISRMEEVAGNDGTDQVAITPESVSSTREGQPEKLRRKLAGDLDAIILKALRKDPDSRYHSVEQFSEDIRHYLEGSPVTARKELLGYQTLAFFRHHRAVLLGSGALLLLGLGLLVVARTQRGASLRQVLARLISSDATAPSHQLVRPGADASVAPRRSVAFLGFKNVSGNPQAAWLSTAFSEMLSTEVAAGEKLRMVPGENVARVKLELSLPDADAYGKETLGRLRSNLGTDVVVLGAYTVLGRGSSGRIRIDLRLQDTLAGETIAAVTETGTEAGLLDLVARAGSRLRERLGTGEVSATDAAGVRASLPANLEAARFYSQGLTKLRLFDALAARDLLLKAVAADPEYPLAHAALAAAWSALGYDGKAGDSAKKAFDLGANLSREERLSVEGRYREIGKEWNKSVEIYQSLFRFFPDNLEYGLRLASAQTSAGRGKDALSVIEMLRKFPMPSADDPRIDLAEAVAAESLSDFQRELALEEKAARKGAALGAQLLVARARLLESRAQRNLGQHERARAAAEEARSIFAAAGHLEGVARSINNLAALKSDQGDLDSSGKLHEEALAICRRIGDKNGMASALNNLAIRLKDQGNLSDALKLHRQALAIRRETDDKSGITFSLNNIAVVLYGMDDLSGAQKLYEESVAVARQMGERRNIVRAEHNLALVLKDRGDLATAKQMMDESLEMRRQLGDKRGIPMAHLALGDILLAQGRFAEARQTIEEALAVETQAGHRRGMAYDLFALGEIALGEGNLSVSRKNHEEALAIREELGEKGTAAESRVALASLAIEEGRLTEAETVARKAADEFASEKARQNEAQAYIALARALLAQHRLAEAQRASARAADLCRNSERKYLSLLARLAVARVAVAQGQAGNARQQLSSILSESQKAGYLPLQFEAQLTAAEIELRFGDAANGIRQLNALQKEASARGFNLVAAKAGKLVAAYR